MTSKDKSKKEYMRSCSGCHIPQPNSAYQLSRKATPVSIKVFTEIHCDSCKRNQRNEIKRSITGYSLEENYLVIKLAPHPFSEPFEMFHDTLSDQTKSGAPIRLA